VTHGRERCTNTSHEEEEENERRDTIIDRREHKIRFEWRKEEKEGATS